MKKSIALLFCLGLCLTLAVFYPRVGWSNPKVDSIDSTGCTACHSFPAGGGLHTTHTNCADCHDGTPGKGNVASSACLACHPAADSEKCDLVNFHEDSTNYTPPEDASCLDCHAAACQAQAEVAIEPATATLNPGDKKIFTATTTGGANTPAYTWEVAGGTAGTGNTTTGDSIEYTAGNTPGNYTIKVTDTANGNIQATAAVTIEAEVLCTVTVLDEQVAKSHWVALPALIRIQTTGLEVSQATDVFFASDADGGAFKSIIPLVKLVIPGTGTINQLAIIPPAIVTGNFDADSETVTVAVEGCAQTDTFDFNILKLGPIPLSK